MVSVSKVPNTGTFRRYQRFFFRQRYQANGEVVNEPTFHNEFDQQQSTVRFCYSQRRRGFRRWAGGSFAENVNIVNELDSRTAS